MDKSRLEPLTWTIRQLYFQPAATTTFQFGAQPPAGLAGTAAPFQFGATTGTPAAPGIPSFMYVEKIDSGLCHCSGKVTNKSK